MAERLTRGEIRAIVEALAARLAGEIDVEHEPGSPRREDYETALDKMQERAARRAPALPSNEWIDELRLRDGVR